MAIFGNHLGPRLNALLNGELSGDDRERALAHLAECAMCSAIAKAQIEHEPKLNAPAQPEPASRMMASLFQIRQSARAAQPQADDFSEPEDLELRAIPEAVNRLAEVAAPLLDVEGRLQQVMGDAHRRPPRVRDRTRLDEIALDEIELYAELMLAAERSKERLSQETIDRILLTARTPPEATNDDDEQSVAHTADAEAAQTLMSLARRRGEAADAERAQRVGDRGGWRP